MRYKSTICLILSLLLIITPVFANSGMWLKDQINGCKVWEQYPTDHHNQSVIWEGKCIDGYAEGTGTLKWYEGSTMYSWGEVTIEKGILNGHAVMHWQDGMEFSGTISKGKIEGQGRYILPGKYTYEGPFRDWYMYGQGVLRFDNGDVYKGTFINNQPTGFGVYHKEGAPYLAESWDATEKIFKKLTPLVPYTLEAEADVIRYDKDLVKKIMLTESMDNNEKQYWLILLSIISIEQKEKLEHILTNEYINLKNFDEAYIKAFAHDYGYQENEVRDLILTEERRREMIAGLGKINLNTPEPKVELKAESEPEAYDTSVERYSEVERDSDGPSVGAVLGVAALLGLAAWLIFGNDDEDDTYSDSSSSPPSIGPGWYSYDYACEKINCGFNSPNVTHTGILRYWAGRIKEVYYNGSNISKVEIIVNWVTDKSPYSCGEELIVSSSDVKNYSAIPVAFKKCK